MERPNVEDKKIREPNWLVGFTAAEGSFEVQITKSQTQSTGYQVQLVFDLTKHMRDEQLMRRLIEYLCCGNIYKKRESLYFIVTKFADIENKIIPLFKKYPIEGIKLKDFQDFCKVAKLMKSKKHLTIDGLEQIRKIKAGMNTGRKES